MKKFGRIFLAAVAGGIIYELLRYFFDNYSPDWKNVILQIFSIALIVSIVIFVITDYLNRKSDNKAKNKSQ